MESSIVFFIAKAKAFFIDEKATSEFNLVLFLIILDPLLIFDNSSVNLPA